MLLLIFKIFHYMMYILHTYIQLTINPPYLHTSHRFLIYSMIFY